MVTDNDIRFTQSGIAIITVMMTALGGAIGLLFRTLMATKDAQNTAAMVAKDAFNAQLLKDKEVLYADLKKERDSFRAMSITAIANLEIVANAIRKEKGVGPLDRLAAVIPESSSPPTALQIASADIATVRARLTAASLALHIPPRSPTGADVLIGADAVRTAVEDFLKISKTSIVTDVHLPEEVEAEIAKMKLIIETQNNTQALGRTTEALDRNSDLIAQDTGDQIPDTSEISASDEVKSKKNPMTSSLADKLEIVDKEE